MSHFTTLNEIKKHRPCREGWVKLLKYLNKSTSDDEPLSFKTILDSNGLDDAIWSLRCHSDEQTVSKFARLCALDVIHLWDAPDIVVKYLKTGDESIREAAEAAAWSAVRLAAEAAEAAAEAAARSAAWTAAWSAVRLAQKDRFLQMFW